MMKGIVRLGLILAAFAAVACVSLAFVNQATEAQIELNQAKQLSESLKGLFPAADGFRDISSEIASPDSSIKFDQSYLVEAAGGAIGLAIKASGPSYGGVAVALVGIDLKRTIAGVRILETKDTPGLGANAAVPTYFVDKSKKTTFPGQFQGKALTDKFVVKDDVTAITASTITSVAITKIIKAAGDSAAAYLDGLALGGK